MPHEGTMIAGPGHNEAVPPPSLSSSLFFSLYLFWLPTLFCTSPPHRHNVIFRSKLIAAPRLVRGKLLSCAHLSDKTTPDCLNKKESIISWALDKVLGLQTWPGAGRAAYRGLLRSNTEPNLTSPGGKYNTVQCVACQHGSNTKTERTIKANGLRIDSPGAQAPEQDFFQF